MQKRYAVQSSWTGLPSVCVTKNTPERKPQMLPLVSRLTSAWLHAGWGFSSLPQIGRMHGGQPSHPALPSHQLALSSHQLGHTWVCGSVLGCCCYFYNMSCGREWWEWRFWSCEGSGRYVLGTLGHFPFSWSPLCRVVAWLKMRRRVAPGLNEG